MATELTNEERAKQIVAKPAGPSPESLQPAELPEPDSSNLAYVPGPVGRGIQSALIQGAFQSLGEAFHGGGYTPVGQAPSESPAISAFRQAGAGVAKALEMRWYQAEFSNFRKQGLAKFQNDVQGLQAQNKFLIKELNRGIWHEADGSVTPYDPDTPKGREQIALRKGELEADMITRIGEMQVAMANDAREKYGVNPLVNEAVQAMYLKASEAMLSRFNPENTLAAEKSRADIRQSEANTIATQAEAAATAQQQNVPKTARAAYETGGVTGLREWINGTDNGQIMWSNVRETFVGEAKADAKAKYWKDNKNLSEDEKERGWAALADQNAARFEKVGQWKWINSTLGPDVAKEFQEANPGYGPDPAGPITPAVKGRELKPAEIKKKARQWGQIALDEYEKYMSIADKDISREDGIDYVMNEWFPDALIKGVKEEDSQYAETINDELTASEGQAAEEYRSYVTEYLKSVLEEHAGVGSALDRSKKGTKAARPPARRRPGGLVRGALHLIGVDDRPPIDEIPKKE